MGLVYRIFLKGLLTLLPITITLYLLVWIMTNAERALGDPLRSYFPEAYFTGIGVILGIILIFLVGLLVNNYLTQRFVGWFERQLEQLPVVRSIYSPIRDVTNLFGRQSTGDGGTGNQQVVLVEIGGCLAMGLVTRETFTDLPAESIPNDCVAVFVPFSYGMGGTTYIVPRSRLRETTIPADRAMQLAITGWIKSSK